MRECIEGKKNNCSLFLYYLQIEPPHADSSELNAIEIICGSRGGVRCGDTASSGQQVWGVWTVEALCPAKTLMVAFSLQVHQYNVSCLCLTIF